MTPYNKSSKKDGYEEIAKDVRRKICDMVFKDMTPSRDVDRKEIEIISSAIHQAVWAEREECAKVAENGTKWCGSYDCCRVEHGDEIAQAIRSRKDL